METCIFTFPLKKKLKQGYYAFINLKIFLIIKIMHDMHDCFYRVEGR